MIDLPPELEVCLSNRCNLACRYCYFTEQNKGKPTALSPEQLKRGIDLWIRHTARRRDASKTDLRWVRKMELVGGEPFLDFPLVRTGVDYAAKRAPDMHVSLYTNGTLLDAPKAGWLLDRDVELVVSLDGRKASTDRNRRWCGKASGSVFDRIMDRLGRLPQKTRRGSKAALTATSATIGSLVRDMRYLEDLGFGEIYLELDMTEVWPRVKLAALRRTLRELREVYVRRLERDISLRDCHKLFSAGFNEEKLRPRSLACPTDEVVLGYDGFFYPCSVPAAMGPGRERFRVGDLKRGVDMRAFSSSMGSLARLLKRERLTECVQCPIGGYYFRVLGRERLKPYFESARRVSDVFREELGPYFEATRALNEAIKEGSFGLFDHPPRRVCERELPALRLDLGKDASARLGPARDALDYFLFSPGRRKRLTIAGAGLSRGFIRAQILSLYALLKSRALGKELRVFVDGGALRPAQAAFLEEHGIARIDRTAVFAQGPADKLRVLALRPSSPGRVRGVLAKHASAGTREIILEADPSADWSGGNMDLLAAAAEEAVSFAERTAGKRPLFILNLCAALAKERDAGGEFSLGRGRWADAGASRALERAVRAEAGRLVRRAGRSPKLRKYLKECILRGKKRSGLFSR